MSITMTPKPCLPSFASFSSTNASERKLPPLASLLNDTTPVDPISPTSSKQVSTDLNTHAITSFPTPASIKKPFRLPSFDSLKFDDNKTPEQRALLDETKRSKSFSVPSTNATPLSKSTIQISPMMSDSAHHLHLPEESPLVEKRAYAFISHSPSTYPSQEPCIDNAQLARRKRRRTTPRELEILQEEFAKGSTPNRVRRIEIASRVDMTEKAVQIWFQNRRQTLRKQSNAEKEVHHIEPIYHPQIPSQHPQEMVSPPKRHQPIVFTAQPHFPPTIQTLHTSSPIGSHTAGDSSPPSKLKSDVASPSTAAVPSVQNLLVTPSRPARNTKTSPMGSTLTFRLTKNTTTESITTTPSNNNQDTTNQSTDKSMTPIKQQQRSRQKPVMRVNPSPPKIHSSPTLTNKENVSPLKVKKESHIVAGQQLQTREPLRELSSNLQHKPNSVKYENECIANLLNLRNSQ